MQIRVRAKITPPPIIMFLSEHQGWSQNVVSPAGVTGSGVPFVSGISVGKGVGVGVGVGFGVGKMTVFPS